MEKINIKQPKYIIPLVILPFVFIIGYSISTFSKDKTKDDGLTSKEELNTELQEAPAGETVSKIDALRNHFKKEGDFTGIQNVEKESDELAENSGSLYQTEEMVYIDSINKVSKIKEEEIKKNTQRYVGKDYNNKNDSIESIEPYSLAETNNPNFSQQSNSIGIQQHQDSTYEQKQQAMIERELARINKQRHKIDSLRTQARLQEETYQNRIQQENENPVKQNDATVETKQQNVNGKTSLVKKYNTATAFNTLSNDDNGNAIVAMLDETVTVQGSSRIRIRLLEDIAIDNVKLKNGDYLYGIVTGINGQRVNIAIKSVMVKGKIYKVNLSVYDNDGIEGFFIPENQFRELTKEIGASTVSQTNFTFENATETFESLLYKTINNVIRQLGSTISKSIQKQKATLKYNTQIYLYNNNEN